MLLCILPIHLYFRGSVHSFYPVTFSGHLLFLPVFFIQLLLVIIGAIERLGVNQDLMCSLSGDSWLFLNSERSDVMELSLLLYDCSVDMILFVL